MMNNDPFFSIDRLVSFGMEMAVAQRMVSSMNNALQGVTIPGPHNPPVGVPSHVYYLILDGKTAGPFTSSETSRLVNEGRINKDTFVWRPGMATWDKFGNVPDLLRMVALMPPPFPGGAST